MKKMIFRVLSYGFDMMVISLITLGLAFVPFINPNNEEYQKQYEELNEIRIEYNTYTGKLDEVLSDNKITQEEYDSLNEYKSYLTDYVDKELTDEDITKFREESYKGYADKYNALAYAMTKNNTITKIITVVITVLYLGVLQFVLKGKTLGKFIFKLKVVDNKDMNKQIPMWKYLVRAVLVGEILIIATDMAFLYATDSNMYLQASNILTTVQYIYEIAFLIVMMMREDTRSIHDLLLGTRVVLFDKDGKEVIETQVDEVEEVKEEPKKEEKKAAKKKTTTKKKTTKKKEFVSAEKVDD